MAKQPERIPKSFQLMGYTWTVVVHKAHLADPDAAGHLFGMCDYNQHVIHISGGLTPEARWHTFLHELTHAVLGAIGREKLNKDEGFVDGFSGALAQALSPPVPVSKRVRARPSGGA